MFLNFFQNKGHQIVNSSSLVPHGDPTLLFTKEQWNELLPQTRFRKEKYVLYYQLMDSKEALSFAKQQAKQRHCQLLIMDARISCIQRPHHISFASPIEFMQAIRDAEFVIPTSFHGTAFSIIFEKQFLTTGLQKNADRGSGYDFSVQSQ